jgi:hypothetical protein
MTFNAATIIGIAMFVNVFLFFSQLAVCDVNPLECPTFYNYEGSSLQELDQGNFTISQDAASELPTGQTSPNPGIGTTVFIDPFNAVKKWFLDTKFGKYLEMFVSAVPNALKTMGLPPEASFALGALWHVVTIIIVVVSVIAGRNT